MLGGELNGLCCGGHKGTAFVLNHWPRLISLLCSSLLLLSEFLIGRGECVMSCDDVSSRLKSTFLLDHCFEVPLMPVDSSLKHVLHPLQRRANQTQTGGVWLTFIPCILVHNDLCFDKLLFQVFCQSCLKDKELASTISRSVEFQAAMFSQAKLTKVLAETHQ